MSARIDELMVPFQAARELIVSIPGVGATTADVVIAETGADLTRFPTPGQLAPWAGVCPGRNESAGTKRTAQTRPGSGHLKGALGASAPSIARMKNTAFLPVKYRCLARSIGKQKANVATEHAERRAIQVLDGFRSTITVRPRGAA